MDDFANDFGKLGTQRRFAVSAQCDTLQLEQLFGDSSEVRQLAQAALESQMKQFLELVRQSRQIHPGISSRHVPVHFAILTVEVASLVRVEINADRQSVRPL